MTGSRLAGALDPLPRGPGGACESGEPPELTEGRCHNCQRDEDELSVALGPPIADGRRYCEGDELDRCDRIARGRIWNATGGPPWLGRA